jgi:hypothetical protein
MQFRLTRDRERERESKEEESNTYQWLSSEYIQSKDFTGVLQERYETIDGCIFEIGEFTVQE